MRYIAPPRDALDPTVFERLPLSAWADDFDLLRAPTWPGIEALNARRPATMREQFVAQTAALLDDGLHYEERIAREGRIATREANWHDLFNALIWIRFPALKRALNRRQMADIAQMGRKQRSRAQYALTHFDEAGVVVTLRDAELLTLWDVHDWYELFWRRREAWHDGSIGITVFGHALLEHGLVAGKLLVGKALVVAAEQGTDDAQCIARCAEAIASGEVLLDPLELRPLPLSGIPGWHRDGDSEAFHRDTPCYQPRREGRQYPPPIRFATSAPRAQCSA